MKNFYKGKKVFITGHTGFKGAWLTRVLLNWGSQIKGYSLKPEEDSLFSKLNLQDEIEHEVGDIRDLGQLEASMSDYQPDIVFHLAAQALVRSSYDDPINTYTTNAIGSLNLLTSVNSCQSIKSLVFVTSDKCYENVEWLWGYRESDPLGGHDPYSSSKACAELIYSSFVRSFWSQRENFSATARAGNVIGGGDFSIDRIIPDCVRASENDGKVLLRSPNSTRPWQHVLEPLSGYMKLAQSLYYKEITELPSNWNFGPSINKEITTGELARLVLEILGSGEVELDPLDHPHEAGLLQLNCDKANIQLDWHPKWSGMDAIINTANWYKDVNSGKNPIEVTNNQILEYFDEQND